MVTAPSIANARPNTVAPVFKVIDCWARMFPWNRVLVPKVAELPICQKTLQAWAPLIRSTLLSEAVVRVVAVWKMNTASGSPWASSVTAPVNPKVPEADL